MKRHHRMSLQRQTGLQYNKYRELLVECGILEEVQCGGKSKYIMKRASWDEFLQSLDGAETDKFKVIGCNGQRYYL